MTESGIDWRINYAEQVFTSRIYCRTKNYVTSKEGVRQQANSPSRYALEYRGFRTKYSYEDLRV